MNVPTAVLQVIHKITPNPNGKAFPRWSAAIVKGIPMMLFS